jgi:hypothetical protein
MPQSIVVGHRATVVGVLVAEDVVVKHGASVTPEDEVTDSPPPTACDDGNACTADSCGGGACQHAPLEAGTSCADDDICNGDETCDGAGSCVQGAPPIADDGKLGS